MKNLRDLYQVVRQWASNYEPAVAATVVAAFFQMLVGVGIAVGDWPSKVDAVLGFVAVLATLVAGRQIRSAVYSPVRHEADVTAARLAGHSMGRIEGHQAAIRDVSEGRS